MEGLIGQPNSLACSAIKIGHPAHIRGPTLNSKVVHDPVLLSQQDTLLLLKFISTKVFLGLALAQLGRTSAQKPEVAITQTLSLWALALQKPDLPDAWGK
ncbi:hypothetical protein AAC387_Pa09g0590 [Persea americana]